MTAPALGSAQFRRPHQRCPRCHGFLQLDTYGGQRRRRCANCGHSPDVPARLPTLAELAAARILEPPSVKFTAVDKRNLTAVLAELVPAKARSRVMGSPASAPSLGALEVEPAGIAIGLPLQPVLFDLGRYADPEPACSRRRRRGQQLSPSRE